MRVLVMGGGAVGGYYGGALAAAGHDVTLVARGPHLAAIQERGIELREESGDRVVRLRAIAEPTQAEANQNLVLFTVKTYDTCAAISALAPAVGDSTSILTLQNGVDSADVLREAFGAERVLAGTTNIFVTVLDPGIVLRRGELRTVTLGEHSGEATPRLAQIAGALRDAGVDVVVVPDIRAAVWEKFVLLAATASLTTVCVASTGEVLREPEGEPLFRGLLREVEAVGRASGVTLRSDIEEHIVAFARSWAFDARSSMQVDFERCRRVELEQVTGTVVRRGHELGVAIPTFELLYAILRIRARAFGGID